jgi:hypothetical protein
MFIVVKEQKKTRTIMVDSNETIWFDMAKRLGVLLLLSWNYCDKKNLAGRGNFMIRGVFLLYYVVAVVKSFQRQHTAYSPLMYYSHVSSSLSSSSLHFYLPCSPTIWKKSCSNRTTCTEKENWNLHRKDVSYYDDATKSSTKDTTKIFDALVLSTTPNNVTY